MMSPSMFHLKSTHSTGIHLFVGNQSNDYAIIVYGVSILYLFIVDTCTPIERRRDSQREQKKKEERDGRLFAENKKKQRPVAGNCLRTEASVPAFLLFRPSAPSVRHAAKKAAHNLSAFGKPCILPRSHKTAKRGRKAAVPFLCVCVCVSGVWACAYSS